MWGRLRGEMPPMALVMALLLYGLASAPAPPGVRLQEALVFAGIAATVGVAAPWRFFSGLQAGTGPLLPAAGSVIMVWLLWQGLVRGLWNGWGLSDMGRDIVPMLFLSLPLLLGPALGRLSWAAADRLADAAAWGGVAFALRWWHDAGSGIMALGSAPLGEGHDYLLNSALVPFGAVWLAVRATSAAVTRSRRPWVRGGMVLVLSLGAAICLLALAATVHRAGFFLSLAAMAVGMGGLLAGPLGRRPAWLVALALAAILGIVALRVPLLGIAGLMVDKTESVGLNNRADELMAVLDQVARSPMAFLIGDGWGALVANPAVGWWRVSYTHSAASYFLLKLGAIGVAFMAVYVGLLARLVVRAAAVCPLLVLAAGPSLVLGLMLHTSFKYLCFSLILSLIAGRAWGAPLQMYK